MSYYLVTHLPVTTCQLLTYSYLQLLSYCYSLAVGLSGLPNCCYSSGYSSSSSCSASYSLQAFVSVQVSDAYKRVEIAVCINISFKLVEVLNF